MTPPLPALTDCNGMNDSYIVFHQLDDGHVQAAINPNE